MKSRREIYELLYRIHKHDEMCNGYSEDKASRIANIRAVKLTDRYFYMINRNITAYWTSDTANLFN